MSPPKWRVRANDLSKSFQIRTAGAGRRATTSSLNALSHVTFSVDEGEIVGVIGQNGAGKSTLLKLIGRITAPTEGTLAIRGRMGSLLEVGTGFHPDLSGHENIYLNGAILGMSRRDVHRRYDEIVEFAGVARFLQEPVKHYSSGMFVRLAFSVAAHLDTEILLVDEVLAVGDAAFQAKCLEKIRGLARDAGRTTLLVSHNLSPIRTLCSRAIVLQQGGILADASPSAAAAAYLDSLSAGIHHAGWTDISRRLNAHPPHRPVCVRVAVLDDQGAPRAVFNQGDNIVVALDLEGFDAFPDGVVGLAILSENDEHLVTVNTPRPLDSAHCASVRATVALDALPLAPGRYWIDVGCTAYPLGGVVDHAERATSFEISAPGTSLTEWVSLHGRGVIRVDADWSFAALTA